MKQVFRLAWNDIRLTTRDAPAFFWLLVLPLIMMWLFSGGGGGGGKPKATLSVVDHDSSWLSRALISELEHETVNLKPLQPDEADDAENKVRTLIIPVGFAEGVIHGKQQTLRFEREPNSNQDYGFAAQVHIMRAIARSLGRLIEIDRVEPLPAGDPAELEAQFLRLAAEPPRVTLDVTTAGVGRPVPTGLAQSVPGMLTFTVMMMTLIYGAVFLAQERSTGMLRRQATLPVSNVEIVAAKVLGRLLIAGLQVVALTLGGRFLFGLSFGDSPAGLALVLFSYAAAVAGLATLLGAVVKDAKQASAIGWIGSMVLAALGGCWWPAEMMPQWMRTAAHAFPTAWAMDAFHALISFGRGIEAVLLPCAVLLAFAGASTLLGARLLRLSA
ncbi:MAG: ABC transporter permease [bacterium]|nr:ABC transporter permease [bacterium]